MAVEVKVLPTARNTALETEKDSESLPTSSSARNELSFTRVKIIFMISRKQTSIWLSAETLSLDRTNWQDSWSTRQYLCAPGSTGIQYLFKLSFISFMCPFRYSVPKKSCTSYIYARVVAIFFGQWNFFMVNVCLPPVNARTTKYRVIHKSVKYVRKLADATVEWRQKWLRL